MVRTIVVWGALLCSTVLYGQHFSFESENNNHNVVPFDVTCSAGITLNDHTTQCAVASDYPLGGPLHLSGGTLNLANNVSGARSLEITSSGTINGHGYTLQLPHRIKPWRVPGSTAFGGSSVEPSLAIKVGRQLLPEKQVGGFDWANVSGISPLVAVADYAMPATFCIGKVAGDQLISQAHTALPIGAREVAWCPQRLSGVIVLAPQPEGGSSLCLFSYSQEARSIALTPVVGHRGAITGLAWSPNGARLAVAEYDEQAVGNRIKLTVYSYNGTSLSVIDQRLLGGDRGAQIRCCAWRPDSTQLIVGRGYSATHPQLMLYRVTDVVITMTHQVSSPIFLPGTEVAAACFAPDTPNRFFIGLANGGGSFRLRSCLISDVDRIIPEQQYEVAQNVYKISLNADRTLFAIETFDASWDRPGTGAISLYPYLNGSIGERCSVYPHAERGRWMKWAPHMSQLGMLDVNNQLMRTTARHGLLLQDVALIGNSTVEWQSGLFVRDAVLVDGQGHAWQTPSLCEWHLQRSSSLSLRNVVLRPTDSLMLCGAGDALCLLENCRLDDGELACHVPTRFTEQCQVRGRLSGHVTLGSRCQLTLNGDTTVTGEIIVEGRVAIHANGHALNFDKAAITLQPGAQLHIYNARVSGMGERIVAESGGQIHLADSRLALNAAGLHDQVNIELENSWVDFLHDSYYVAYAMYAGGTDASLWEVVKQSGTIPATSSQNSAPQESLPGVGQAAAGAVDISTSEVILEHDWVLSTRTPLHINTDTVIRGNGYAIKCARTTDPLFVLGDNVHLTFVDTVIEGITPATLAGGSNCMVEWGSNCHVLLAGGGALTMPWYVSGDNIRIDGNMHELTLSGEAGMRVRGHSSVLFDRLTFLNVAGTRLTADSPTTTVKLRNVSLQLSGDMTLANGSWKVMRDATVSGPYRLMYRSSKPMSIEKNAALTFKDGARFAYAPLNNAAHGFVCDPAGTVVLDNAVLESHIPAMEILEGNMVFKGYVGLVAHEGCELRLGSKSVNEDGITAATYVHLNPEPGSAAHLFGRIKMNLKDDQRAVFS